MSDIPPQEPRNEPPITEGYVEYPRAFAQYPGYEFRAPVVDLSVLSRAWPAVQQQLSTWVVAMLLVGVVFGIFYGAFIFVMMGLGMATAVTSQNSEPNFASMFAMFGVEIVGVFVITAVMYMLMGGLYGMALKQLKGESISATDVFQFRGQIVQIIIASILMMFITTIGGMMCLVPGLLAQGVLMFTLPLILDRKMNAVDAMKQSFETLKPQMWMALLVHFVLNLVAQLGTFACLVGVLVTAPVYIMSIAMMYRDFFWQAPETAKFAPRQVL